MVQYLMHWDRRPISEEARNKLRVECPRPNVPDKVAETVTVDPNVGQFLSKTNWYPHKGLELALKACHD